MEKISNHEPLEIKDEWLDDAAKDFRKSLEKQLKPEPRKFYVRMSNIGRPLCQLQMEARGETAERMPYNHVIRMLLGDATEAIMTVVLKAAGVNITGSKERAQLIFGDYDPVDGEDDIEIEGAVWDIKSTSPWAFDNKWAGGYRSVREHDDFGYVGQLVGYARGRNKKAGGWFVVNKSTGEIKVVPVEFRPGEEDVVLKEMAATVAAMGDSIPFQRQFEPIKETFRKKETGNMILPMTCSFCQYKQKCWPDAQRLPRAGSKAKEPTMVWYTEYHDEQDD